MDIFKSYLYSIWLCDIGNIIYIKVSDLEKNQRKSCPMSMNNNNHNFFYCKSSIYQKITTAEQPHSVWCMPVSYCFRFLTWHVTGHTNMILLYYYTKCTMRTINHP